MAYWMFNPCSPCCTTAVQIYCSGCQIPTGDLHYFLRPTPPSINFKKYTAQRVNDVWTWTIPLSDYYQSDVNDTVMRTYDGSGPSGGGWFPLKIPICTQGESSDFVVIMSGFRACSSINPVTQTSWGGCGFIASISTQYKNNGPCYWGQNRANSFQIPYQSHIVTSTGVNPGTDGAIGRVGYAPEVASGAGLCLDACDVLQSLGYNNNNEYTYNCKEHGGIFHLPFYTTSKRSPAELLPLYSDIRMDGSVITDNENYSILDRASGFFFGFCSFGKICPIPSSIFLEMRSYTYKSNFHNDATRDFVGGIEIDDIVQLDYSESSGCWVGNNLPYTMHGRLCCTGNPPDWKEYDTPSYNVSGYNTATISEQQTFKEVILRPDFQFLAGVPTFNSARKKPQIGFSIILKDDYVRTFVDFVCTGYLQARCNPFVIDVSTQHPCTFFNAVASPPFYHLGQTYFTDSRLVPRLTGIFPMGFYASEDGVNDRFSSVFPFYSGYGMGYEDFNTTFIPPFGIDQARFNRCGLSSGYLRITE